MASYLTESSGAVGGSPASLDYVQTQTVSATSTAVQTMAAPLSLANQGADPAAPSGGAVLYPKGGQWFQENSQGLVTSLVGSGGGITSAVTVANTMTETALLAWTIPANLPAATAVYRMKGWGVYSDTATPTLTFTSYYGGLAGTQIAQVPAVTLGSGVSGCLFEFIAELAFYSTTKAQGSLKLLLGTSSTTDAASAYVASPTATAGVTVATTSAADFAVSVKWSAASSSNTLSLLYGYPERVA